MSGPFIKFDSRGIDSLAVELPRLGKASAKVMQTVIVEGGVAVREAWRANAVLTSGEHGKHYPKSITSEVVLSTDIVVEIGPDPRLPQGGMSFEEGSVNQPPHLDGQKAEDTELPKIAKRIDSALGLLGF